MDVATVSECEACFTPDACRLRGTCDHYAASKLRIAAAPSPAEVPMPEPVAWMWQTVKGTCLSLTEPADYETAYHLEPLVPRSDALAYAAAREAAAVERERAKTEKWRHVANEWADMATNGIQWVQNIKDGISTLGDALANLNECLAHCRKVDDAAPREAAARERVIAVYERHAHAMMSATGTIRGTLLGLLAAARAELGEGR